MAYTYFIEWQKRRLPHARILILLANQIPPRFIDNFISAEIPNVHADRRLHEIAVRHMVHGPCGILNRGSPCMNNNICTKKYPRKFNK